MPGRVPGLDAAMEPGLRDRENADLYAWVPLTRECRNGARPERPGKPATGAAQCARGRCRNGARPERPGKLAPQAEWHYPGDSRNGARPERPGKHGAKGTPLEIPLAPQWSPA